MEAESQRICRLPEARQEESLIEEVRIRMLWVNQVQLDHEVQ